MLEKVPHTPTAPEKAAVIRETTLVAQRRRGKGGSPQGSPKPQQPASPQSLGLASGGPGKSCGACRAQSPACPRAPTSPTRLRDWRSWERRPQPTSHCTFCHEDHCPADHRQSGALATVLTHPPGSRAHMLSVSHTCPAPVTISTTTHTVFH